MAYEGSAEPALILTDDEFLKLCKAEREAGIGFDQDDELAEARITALNYGKGEMPDMPTQKNRSKAVSTDVADAIETAMPDLLEIFLGGDDVASFPAASAADEAQAKIETDTVLNVVLEENDAFTVFGTAFKDALMTKIGVFTARVDEHTEIEAEETAEDVPLVYLEIAEQLARMHGYDQVEIEEDAEAGTFRATMRRTKTTPCIRIAAWPSEDFAHARDTVNLREATWFGLRARPRAQELIEDGYDRELVEQLPPYTVHQAEELERARDTAGEHDDPATTDPSNLRQVEIYHHFLRVDADGDGKTELWRIVTGKDDAVLLEKERIDFPTVAVITPHLVPHRLLGRSLADLLLEVQRIKTALLRMLLDSGYFALNQRMEVATGQGKANQFTLSDLMRNEPNMPVRSDDGQSVRPLTAGGLNFDVTGALEYVSTVAEQRTGIVRNAQGLNPDTLHDTKGGMERMVAAAQKRLRLIARTFAETGVKDLFLIVHQLLRKHGAAIDGYAIGLDQQVDPKQWRARRNLRVEIGVGSGGRDYDIAASGQLIGLQERAVELQGGLDGPLLTRQQIYAARKRLTERLGFKNPDLFWTDPAQSQAQPGMSKEQAKAMGEVEIAKAKGQIELQLKGMEIKSRETLERERMAMEDARAREQMERELAMRRDELAAERQMRFEQAVLGAEPSPNLPNVHIGGEPG